MKKKRAFKIILIVLGVLLSPFLLLILGCLLLLFVFTIRSNIKTNNIKKEIFSYVLENRVSLEETTEKNKKIIYDSTGLQDGGVTYGYFFSETEEEYYDKNRLNPRRAYRSGVRTDGYPDDPADWLYTERICDNWYYYEVHDG